MAKGVLISNPGKQCLQARAKRYKKSNCEICGTKENLGVHHNNFDASDNSPDNVMTLCGSCHTKWHWQNGKQPWKKAA